jgi:transcriptional regulator with XRE-family HTH domain
MIKNQKQAAMVKKEIVGIIDLLADMDKISKEQKLDLKQQLQYAVLKSRIEELNLEIDEYDHLTSADLPSLEIKTNELQKAIVCFRIASGLTQKDLADKLEIQEQQIQRYEQNDYLTASFERIIQILQTLEVEVTLKKEFSKMTKVVDFNKFLIPDRDKNILENTVLRVSSRKQLVNW